jgi:hypothetical protein
VIEISRSNWLVTIRTVFFAAEPIRSDAKADVIGCIQFARPDQGFRRVRTLHIDLTRDVADLFGDLGKSTKNQVNRAKKRDQLRYTAVAQPADSDISAFREFYNGFARVKGTTQCRRYHVHTLRLLMRQNGLVITRASDPEGGVLCYHVYVADGTRAMLLYSGSHFRSAADSMERNRLARANRYLHWNDILFFKQRGFALYDWGGLTDDARVAEFKHSFGGTDVAEYTGYVGITWKGRVAAHCRAVLSTVRRVVFSPS